MKKKIILVAIIIVLAIVGVVGYMLASSLMQEITLRKEADAIGKLDITKDSIDMEIKTKGDLSNEQK